MMIQMTIQLLQHAAAITVPVLAALLFAGTHYFAWRAGRSERSVSADSRSHRGRGGLGARRAESEIMR